jgi:uncharacterized protein
MSTITTNSGKVVDFLNPNPESICILDIARALSKICRYSGQCESFYSVGEHSIILSDIVRKMGGTAREQLSALLHDSTEAYMADIPRGLKRLIPEYSKIEKRLMSVIAEALGTEEMNPFVKDLDTNIVKNESDLLLKKKPTWSFKYQTVPYFKMYFYGAGMSELPFLDRYYRLKDEMKEEDSYDLRMQRILSTR